MFIEKIKLYEDREDVTLTTYVIGQEPELSIQGNRPAIIICPGGAYQFCSDREAEPVALRFAAMGYHAFVLKYSVYGEGKSTNWDNKSEMSEKPHCIHPNPMRELGKSMLIIRENADKWRVDTEKIAICGFSAGGHNVAMYGVNWDKPILTDYFNVDKYMLKPAAMILSYPVIDFLYMKEVKKDENSKRLLEIMNVAIAGTKNPSNELCKELSPNLFVNENTPPTFIWATANDNTVNVEQSLKMAYALAEKKIPFEIHIFENGLHGISLATRATASAKGHINLDALKWVELAENWLNKKFEIKW